MPQRFFRKKPQNRVVRPINRGIPMKSVNTESKNKDLKQTENMDSNIEKLREIVGADVKIPKRKVKVEKKDKGLIERTEESTILLTEDNKMMLTD